jgi:hypothetical protein
VLKQLKLLYDMEGLDAERLTYRRVVHLNAMKAIQVLANFQRIHNIPLEHPENEEFIETIFRLEAPLKRYSITSEKCINPVMPIKITEAKAETDLFTEMVPAIKALWADQTIIQIYNTIARNHVQDSAK